MTSTADYTHDHTIKGGTGNDTIYGNSSVTNKSDGTTYQFSAGDGNDIIYNFTKYDRISLGGGNYKRSTLGNDVIVSMSGGDSITLKNAKGKTISIVGGTNIDNTEKNSWRLSGTTATYGTSSKTLVKVTGVKSLDGISLKNKVVTIAASSLNKKKVSITGDGYTLKLASDVSTAAATSNSWSYKNSVATYKQTKGEKYSLASNGKSISYTAGTSKTLATVSGVKSTSGLSVKNKVVTVAASSLNKKKVSITGDGYKLALAKGVSTSANAKNAWSYSNSTATYKQTKGEKYSLASNGKSISYTAGTSKTLATVNGVKSASGLKVSDKVITVPNAVIGSNKKVSVSGSGYNFKFAAQKASIAGSKNADIITSTGDNSTINAGKGNDSINISGANNVIVYKSGDGSDTVTNYSADDTIKITSGTAKVAKSGSNVVFTVGNSSITLKDAASKTVTYYANGTKKTYSASSSKPYTVKGKGVTLSSSYSEKTFDVNNITDGAKIVTIDASAVNHKLKVKGNELANKIIGGSAGGTLDGGKGTVSDTLIGGDGSDIFIYYEGDGNDVITGYDAKDTIAIEEGVVSTIKPSREDVVLQVGDGKLTVQDVKGTHISFVEDGIEYGCLDGKRTLTISQTKNDTIATLSKNYRKDSFDATKIGNEDVGNSITKIYASSVARTLKITGNDKANQILGSSTKANTITGGGGDDTLQGGSGADVFVYAAGDGNDSIIGYDKSDKISVTSGTVDNVSLNSDNAVVLTIGAGKIILDNAAGKTFTYYDANHAAGVSSLAGVYSPGNVVDNWFVADDDNFATDNDLSALVQNKATDYSVINVESALRSANALETLTCLGKT